MLFDIQNNILEIKDLYGDIVRQFDLSDFGFGKKAEINHAASTRDRSTVAISFQVVDLDGFKITKRHNEGILLCDMNTGDINMIYEKTCHDVMFDKADDGKLYINTKGTIASLCIANKEITKIYKFRNFVEAPINMKQSEDGKYLLFSKYKSDNRVLHLINLEANSLESIVGITFGYDFINNNEVIHSLSSGLKIYNIQGKKNSTPIPNASKLLKLAKDSPYVHQISEALHISGQDKLILNDVFAPHAFLKRIYFKVRITSHLKDFSKWCSMDKNFGDFQIHFENPLPYGRGEMYTYGDFSKEIFVINDGYDNCYIYDGDKAYTLEQYRPIHIN